MKVVLGTKGDGKDPVKRPFLASLKSHPDVVVLVGNANAIIIEGGKHMRAGTYFSDPFNSDFKPFPVGSKIMLEN